MKVVALLLAFAAMTLLGPTARSAPVDPVRATLIDQAGRRFSFEQLRGAPVAVTFIATRCTDACPMVNAWFMRLQKELVRRRINATLLTVTLDPKYDTPRVMAAEARALGADPRIWRLASGSTASIDAVLGAFRVHPELDERGIPDIHTTFVYVLNARGKVGDIELPSANIVKDTIAALQAGA